MSPIAVDQLEHLYERVQDAGGHFDQERLFRAMNIAQELYKDKVHWTQVPLFEHVIGVLEVLMPFQPDEDAVIACLLHHGLQEGMSLTELEDQFGVHVRKLVAGAHLIAHVKLSGRRRSIEDLRLMLLTVSEDIRTLLIVLCDRVHVASLLQQVEKEERMEAAREIVQLYAPVAARLGIYTLKHQLESAAFPVLYTSDSTRIAEQLERLHREKGDFLPKAAKSLHSFLEEQSIEARVGSRQKQPFSIFTKMNRKSVTHVDDIYDLFAIRVVVGSVEDCYQVLGQLHRVGKPLANRFKDYISFPKPNGYQSLHTTLVQMPGCPRDAFIEVQIRTEDMDREAKFGVAAHWCYKESGSTKWSMERAQLTEMLVGQQSVENDKESSFADHIFVLTPRGDIIELPEGATPLDFAFQVHTDLGLSFRNAKVNGSIVPLDYELENGDVVEIQKFSNPRPSVRWMQLLRMASSRSKLKRYLYNQERPSLVVKGRELMNQELRAHNLPPLDTDLSILKSIDGQTRSFHEREDMLMKIGQGSERITPILVKAGLVQPKKEQKKSTVGGLFRRKRTGEVRVEGNLPMPTKFAKCCQPEVGKREKLVGTIGSKGKVRIHRHTCDLLKHVNDERKVKVWWA